MNLNEVRLIGRVGNFIETKVFSKVQENGEVRISTKTKFTLIVDRAMTMEPNVFTVTTWQPIASWLRRGRLVLFSGELYSWHTESSHGIDLIGGITFLDKKPEVVLPELEQIQE